MNSNAWILLAALICLFIGLAFGVRAIRSQDATLHKQIYIGTTLIMLSCALIGGIGVTWRMTRTPSYTPESAPLPAQSQVIMNQWSGQESSFFRASLSGKDGEVHWRYPVQSQCANSLLTTLANGIIYEKGTFPEKQDICIQASRLDNGTVLWSTHIKSSQPPSNLQPAPVSNEQLFSPTRDQLLVVDGKLILQVDDNMYVLNAQDGKILRMIKPGVSGYDAIVSNFATNNKVLIIDYSYAESMEKGLSDIFVCVQLADGKVLWKSARGKYQDLIAVQGNTLYTQGKSIVALRVQDGSQLWQANLPHFSIVGSSASSERVYVRAQKSSGSADAFVYALDAHNGRLLWKVPVDTWSGGSPVEADGITYITDTNTLSAYRANNGQLLWQQRENPLPNTAIAFNPYDRITFAQPIVVDGMVFVITSFGVSYPPPLVLIPRFCLGGCTPITGLFAFRASDGKPYWHQQVQGALIAVYK
ncbi:MAG TPA: PQQ-binding-like beta-propeller repeat protein [Ktedonobacteraceae bacterium]|nr:PQQ-binding-like beta-propeller repeat protein [Ktedonobacteraceae bacterium]